MPTGSDGSSHTAETTVVNTAVSTVQRSPSEQILGKVESQSAPISIVSSDYAHRYRSMLINWIIAAKTLVDPPISNLIVFALDQKLCTKVLLKRNFGC